MSAGPAAGATKRRGRRKSRDKLRRAASFLRAFGHADRLLLLARLAGGEICVSELAESLAEAMPAVSQRLRILLTEGLVRRRREGRHVYYSLASANVRALLFSALDHAGEAPIGDDAPTRASPPVARRVVAARTRPAATRARRTR